MITWWTLNSVLFNRRLKRGIPVRFTAFYYSVKVRGIRPFLLLGQQDESFDINIALPVVRMGHIILYLVYIAAYFLSLKILRVVNKVWRYEFPLKVTMKN